MYLPVMKIITIRNRQDNEYFIIIDATNKPIITLQSKQVWVITVFPIINLDIIFITYKIIAPCKSISFIEL